jgi:hypothetical protein
MRLTLRTLLAYLDDVLDPVDKEELAHKIESSEFAEDLVHRTRDTVRRLRLSAPQVIGTGMGLDPNTVAEYLDNVMPPEQVGDFERICLESDVHLAEATACHHVLTMVLGEPADVDPRARQRMYTIATDAASRKQLRIEPAHKPIAAATAAAPAAAAAAMPASVIPSAAPTRTRAIEVPDYLRAAPWWRSTPVLFGLAAVVIVGTALVFASGVRGWLGGNQTLQPLTLDNQPPATDKVAMNTAPPALESSAAAAVESSATEPNSNGAGASLASPAQPTTPGITPPATSTTPAESVTATTSVESGAQPYAVTNPATDAPPSASAELPAAPPLASETPPAAATSTPPSETSTVTLSIPPQPAPSDVAAPAASDAATGSPPVTSVAAASTPPQAGAPAPPPIEATSIPGAAAADANTAKEAVAPVTAPAAPPDSGTYMGGKTVLLQHDDKSGAWFRVEPRSPIVPGERVLSLPEFRPRIALTSGVQLDLSGGTQAIMGIADGGAAHADAAAAAAAPPSELVPALELVYGRIVLINPTNGEKQVRLKLGPASGVAKLKRNASLAVEVQRKFMPGVDPKQTASPTEIHLYAPDGGVVWTDAAGEKTADKASRWSLAEAGAGDMAADPSPPEWIDREPIVQLSEQRYGAPVIESTLVSNAPIDTQLLELFQGSSRKEVKSLVARSSIHVGLFQPFVDALRDSEQKANWKSHIDTLRSAMALGPDSANKVYQALVDQRGKPAAADLYEMLCSYSPDQVGHTAEQMKNGPVVKLINWLEDDSLDYRVLAVQDLWEITGKRLMPNPAASLAERKQNVRVWRSRLESGQLLKPAATTRGEEESAATK